MNSKIGISVRELLKDDGFAGIKVLSGHEGLDNLIRGVNVLEVPDAIDWIHADDFILTTAYALKDDIDKMPDFIKELKGKGIACLGIKVKRYIDEVPAVVLEFSEEAKLPIVSIPYETSFGDLINMTLSKIVNRQTDLLIRMNSFNNSIKDLMLRGGNLMEIAGMIAEEAGKPLAITDVIFNEYVVFDDGPLKYDYEKITSEELAAKSKDRTHYSNLSMTTVMDNIDGKEHRRYIIPIHSSESYYGDLYLWDRDEELSAEMITLIESAASLIALNSAKRLSIYDNENKHKIEFFEDLLSEDHQKKQKAIDKSNFFDFDKSLGYCVVMVKTHELDMDISPTPNNTKILKQLESKLISIIKRIKRLYEGNFIYANKSDRIVFLLGFNKKLTEETIRHNIDDFTEKILGLFEKEGIYNHVSIGVGRYYKDYKMLHASYKESSRAVQRLEMSKKKRVMHYDDLGIYRILSHDEIRDDVLQFSKELLGPLMDYDRQRDADLIKTLKAYFEAGGNVKRVSERLFTHYNTVIYRMQRIKEIADVDLEDSDMMLNLHIALKIMEVVDTERS